MQSPCELSPRFQILFWIAFCFSFLAFGMTAYDGYQRLYVTRPVVRDAAADTLQRVSRLMVLPEDEVPTIATVSDPEQLKGSAIFEDAEVGDKLIIYTRAGFVILYSPAYERIVRVAPMHVGATSTVMDKSR